MAVQSHAVTLPSHAALAEIRDSLLETYASNDAMNQLILSRLDPRAWRAQPPGAPITPRFSAHSVPNDTNAPNTTNTKESS